jgi:hypothetical protein
MAKVFYTSCQPDTIMEGKIYFAILGLLILQSIAALFLGIAAKIYLIEYVVAVWFMLVFVIYLYVGVKHPRHGAAVAAFGFFVGMLNILYLAFHVLNLWIVVVLCLSAAGMIMAMDVYSVKKKLKPVLVYDVSEGPRVQGSKK